MKSDCFLKFQYIIGSRMTPSCVAFADDEILVGKGAQNQITFNAKNTVYGKFL